MAQNYGFRSNIGRKIVDMATKEEIRQLYHSGYSTYEIAKLLDIAECEVVYALGK